MMTKEEIKKQILDGKLTITDVIDVVVEINGIIGVGLITLGAQLKEYCWSHDRLSKVAHDLNGYSQEEGEHPQTAYYECPMEHEPPCRHNPA